MHADELGDLPGRGWRVVGTTGTRRGGSRPGERWTGWLLIVLSVVLTLVVQPLGEVGGRLWLLGDLATARSESVEVRQLPFFEGRYRSASVYALHYQFRGSDGRVYTGVSYVSDRELGSDRNRAVVEYRAGFPEVSRLKGHRLTPGGPLGLVVLVPGLFGVLLLRSRPAVSGRASWPRLR